MTICKARDIVCKALEVCVGFFSKLRTGRVFEVYAMARLFSETSQNPKPSSSVCHDD